MSSLVVPAITLLASRPNPDLLPTGVWQLDSARCGIPRGAITEVSGHRSSGKTSLLMSIFAQATRSGETCAWVDTSDRFDPAAAARSGVALENLLWVRCRNDAGAGLKATDLLLHGGGFGLVCFDLSDVPAKILNRLPASYWYRFRLVIENTPTILLILSEQPNARSCALRAMECRQAGIGWTGPENARLLESLRTEVVPRKPVQSAIAFRANAF